LTENKSVPDGSLAPKSFTEKFVLGTIGAPFGVKGFIKVRSLSGEIDHLLNLQSVVVNKDGKELLYQIEESSPSGTPGSLLIRFKGIDSPEAAKTLNGAQLLGSREQAAPLGKGEFYIEDLKGLPVITEDGENIGCIIDIIEGGGGELAEIQLINEEKKLIPLRDEFLLINFEKSRIILQNLWILE